MKERILQTLSEKLSLLYGVQDISLTLENPPKAELGDFCISCFSLAKILKIAPQSIAQNLKENLEKEKSESSLFTKIEVLGAYVNFFIDPLLYAQEMEKFFHDPREFLYPEREKNTQKTLIVDFIGANVGKPLHIGHMCTPNQGQVFIHLYKKLGWHVVSDSHIGDWGIIFGKLITGYKRYGNKEELEKDAVEHLLSIYIRISEDAEKDPRFEEDFRVAFQLLSQGDQESIEYWKNFTALSIQSLKKSLSTLFVHSDFDIGESFYEGIGLPKLQNYPDLKYSMKDIVQELITQKIATQNEDGSVGVVFPDALKIPSCILQKRDGAHGYLASDLACVKYRVENWNPQKILYFVDARQQLHLKQVFCIARLAGWISSDFDIFHAYNGFISLKDGAMSTRTGKIIRLQDLITESYDRAHALLQEKRPDIEGKEAKEIAHKIGIAAIKYGYLKKSRENDVIFDWDEFMSFEGNSGPYLQYGYVRAKKLFDANNQTGHASNKEFLLSEKEEIEFLQQFFRFPEYLALTLDGYHAHHLCSFLYELTKKFNSFYNSVPILQEKNIQKKKTRFALLQMYIFCMEELFSVLALPLPEKM